MRVIGAWLDRGDGDRYALGMRMAGPPGLPEKGMSSLRRKMLTASGMALADWRLIVEASAALLSHGCAACCRSTSLPASWVAFLHRIADRALLPRPPLPHPRRKPRRT